MTGVTIERKVHFARGRRARKVIEHGQQPASDPTLVGRVPRIARLMALAIRFDRLIEEGEVADQADLARLGHVTRARVTQIMNLLHLAPDIQEAILFLPRTKRGRDPIRERMVRRIVAEPDWRKQRRMWRGIAAGTQAGSALAIHWHCNRGLIAGFACIENLVDNCPLCLL